MALMFTGLLYMQFVYIEEMVKMREQHFSEGVKRSLYSLSTALEKNETKQYLYEELLMIDPGMSDAGSLLDTGDILEYGTGELVGNEIASSVNLREQDKFREFQESLKKQYLYQKGLLNEVILSILNQSSNLPIMERADTAQVNTYLKAELAIMALIWIGNTPLLTIMERLYTRRRATMRMSTSRHCLLKRCFPTTRNRAVII